MLEIIKDYPDDIKPDWLAAARAWRLPYWDWAQKKFRLSGGWRGIPEYIYDLPIIAKNPSVEVTDGNVQKTIPNPFYKFTTPDGKTMGSYGNLGLTAVTDDGVTYPVSIVVVNRSEYSESLHFYSTISAYRRADARLAMTRTTRHPFKRGRMAWRTTEM